MEQHCDRTKIQEHLLESEPLFLHNFEPTLHSIHNTVKVSLLELIFLCCCLKDDSQWSWGLLLALCLEVTPGRAQDTVHDDGNLNCIQSKGSNPLIYLSGLKECSWVNRHWWLFCFVLFCFRTVAWIILEIIKRKKGR